MKEYVIITDSGCDMEYEVLAQWGVRCIDLFYRKAEEDVLYPNSSVNLPEFYAQMREGTVYQTSAINPDDCRGAFVKALDEGKDVLYIGLSSGISTTSNVARLTAEELAAEYPGQDIRVIDSLCASGGQGMLVYFAVKKQREGMPLNELYDHLTALVPKMAHWVTVEDLQYLKRGGRISATAAFAGTVLNLKPVIHVDDEGKLANTAKVRGRRQAIRHLADKYAQLAEQTDGEYFITHADCPEDAKALESMIEEKYGRKATSISQIGPVIGAHAGPGTLALFFLGAER